MNSEKTTLSSLRNIEWRLVKAQKNQMNQVLAYISMNNLTELNKLIYVGVKLVCQKIGSPQKAQKKNQNQVGTFDYKLRLKKIYENT